MFYSTGNNFGADRILFKSYQASNYVVLNAKFTIDPMDERYRLNQQPEIYVPALSIDRSAVAGVFCRFEEVRTYSGRNYRYDGGTVLKSWIRDRNTICIEKVPGFYEKGPLTFYIQALYPMLNQGTNTIKGTRQQLTIEAPDNFLRLGYDSFFVAFEHWAFLHMQFYGCSYSYQYAPWEFTLVDFPTDIDAFVPVPGGGNQFNPECDGMGECRINEGVFTMEERVIGFWDTGHDPFLYAFLVRGDNDYEVNI